MSTKVEPCHFSNVDVIQGKPVSTAGPAEGRATQSHLQTAAAASSWESPSNLSVGEGRMDTSAVKKRAPFLLELFCGTAGVCAQFRLLGGKALGIDHHLKRGKLKAAAVKLDLTQQWVQDFVERELRLGRVEAVHMGPPCGTASKARNIPIRKN